MTAQFPDIIRFAGATYPLMCNPLERLFDQGHPRHPFVSESTANWRGYVAHWEVDDIASGRLVQTAIVSDAELQRQKAELQRQKADARLGNLPRLLKRFPRLWAGYLAISARRNATQQVSPLQDLDDRELLRRLQNFLASIRRRSGNCRTAERGGPIGLVAASNLMRADAC